MAKDNVRNTPKESPKKAVAHTPAPDTYYVSEFVSGAKEIFGTMPECVTAAFRQKGVNKATMEEAKQIVSEFLKKEVK